MIVVPTSVGTDQVPGAHPVGVDGGLQRNLIDAHQGVRIRSASYILYELTYSTARISKIGKR